MNIYKKQILLALLILSAGLFTGNAIAMDDDFNVIRRYISPREREVVSEIQQIYYEITALDETINRKIIRVKTTQYMVNFTDDHEKLLKKEHEMDREIDFNDDILRRRRLMDKQDALFDEWDGMS